MGCFISFWCYNCMTNKQINYPQNARTIKVFSELHYGHFYVQRSHSSVWHGDYIIESLLLNHTVFKRVWRFQRDTIYRRFITNSTFIYFSNALFIIHCMFYCTKVAIYFSLAIWSINKHRTFPDWKGNWKNHPVEENRHPRHQILRPKMFPWTWRKYQSHMAPVPFRRRGKVSSHCWNSKLVHSDNWWQLKKSFENEHIPNFKNGSVYMCIISDVTIKCGSKIVKNNRFDVLLL